METKTNLEILKGIYKEQENLVLSAMGQIARVCLCQKDGVLTYGNTRYKVTYKHISCQDHEVMGTPMSWDRKGFHIQIAVNDYDFVDMYSDDGYTHPLSICMIADRINKAVQEGGITLDWEELKHNCEQLLPNDLFAVPQGVEFWLGDMKKIDGRVLHTLSVTFGDSQEQYDSAMEVLKAFRECMGTDTFVDNKEYTFIIG